MKKSTFKKTHLFPTVFFRCAISLIICCISISYAQFVHPGIFNTQAEFDFIKEKVNATAAHPMKTGYQALKAFSCASLNYVPTPEANVEVVASGIGPSEANFRDASLAAYAHALQWVITGNAAYRDKAIEILNAWGRVFVSMTPATQQRQLEAAWVLPAWIAGAEIIRYYNSGAAGWNSADISRFCGMLDILYDYTKIICNDKRTNNWGSSAALSMLAVGVFENDTVKFKAGRVFFTYLLPFQVEKTGLLMETCRDCNHAEYNIIGMLQAAEVAWHQGVDLYGIKLDNQATPRLMMGMEFHANALLGTPLDVGQSCGLVDCSGDDLHGPGWEIGRNHYKFRANQSIPATDKFVTTLNRPVGTSEMHFPEWSTLTHADLGNIPTMAVTARENALSRSPRPRAHVFYYHHGAGAHFPWSRSTSEPENGDVEILTLQGKLVCTVKAGDGTVGESSLNAGLLPAGGIYLYRFSPSHLFANRIE